jgi:hypothetical protein
MPMPLGTLDALHLATARIWRPHRVAADHGDARHRPPIAARAFGFAERGI